jgi:hypothetical protein
MPHPSSSLSIPNVEAQVLACREAASPSAVLGSCASWYWCSEQTDYIGKDAVTDPSRQQELR